MDDIEARFTALSQNAPALAERGARQRSERIRAMTAAQALADPPWDEGGRQAVVIAVGVHDVVTAAPIPPPSPPSPLALPPPPLSVFQGVPDERACPTPVADDQ